MEQLWDNAEYMRNNLKAMGFDTGPSNTPIVPIVIRNAHDAMPRGSNVFRPTAVEVIVKDAISVEDWNKGNMDEKIREVRGMFLKELGQ